MRIQLHTVKTFLILLVGLIIVCKISAARVNKNTAKIWKPTLVLNKQLKFKPNAIKSIHRISWSPDEPYIDFSFKNIFPPEEYTAVYPVCATVGYFSPNNKKSLVLLNYCTHKNCNLNMRSYFVQKYLPLEIQFDSNSPIDLYLTVKCEYANPFQEPFSKVFEWNFNIKIQDRRWYKLFLVGF
ncbi:hypothetical protein HMI55_000552 [Coelomomyces lativittatus]|nr:hypothetical protein HMI55_000552 [Coelomomyces lativittatus]